MKRFPWAIARVCRTALVCSTLAALSAIALLGQGLHLISGVAPVGHSGHCHSATHAPTACCAHGHAAESAAQAGEHGDCAWRAVAGQHDCQSCPICTLLAAGKVLTAKSRPISRPTCISPAPSWEPPFVLAVSLRILGPRGPPRV